MVTRSVIAKTKKTSGKNISLILHVMMVT